MSSEKLMVVTDESESEQNSNTPEIDPNIKPLDVKPGDYIKDKSGNITRVEYVDEVGNVVTVWGRQLLATELVANGIETFVPIAPTVAGQAVKLLDGSNTRSILFEGITYRVSNVDEYGVELLNVPGIFSKDIFTKL